MALLATDFLAFHHVRFGTFFVSNLNLASGIYAHWLSSCWSWDRCKSWGWDGRLGWSWDWCFGWGWSRITATTHKRSVAGSSRKTVTEVLRFFGNDRSFHVQRIRLECFDFLEESRITEVTRVLIGALGAITVGKELFAEVVGHCSLTVILAIIQDILQEAHVPAGHVIGMVNAGSISELMQPPS